MNEKEQQLIDRVAMELYVRRVFNIKDMKDYELEQSAADCFRKAKIFVQARNKNA